MDGMLTARRLIAEEREKKTGFLDLGELGLSELPSELFALTHLRVLNLGNFFTDEKGKWNWSSNREGTNTIPILPDGLKYLSSLILLSISQTQVSDLSPLKGLSSLKSVNCWGTQVSDLSPLKGLSSLKSVDCSQTQVNDLSPLKGLSSLQEVDCSQTQVSDLSPLKGLSSLQEVSCSATQVSDLSPLKG
ncbi:MAG: leucine-rich repeat domain-containing protein, partial [Verrucomicrobia bacterium]|nr:leucine-rich repeat domain-containing protein [Verrucomicrobiota bacterium]